MVCCYLAADIAVEGFLALSTFGQAFFSVDDKGVELSFVVLYSTRELFFATIQTHTYTIHHT